MEQSFLQAEVSLLVLRHLAKIGCNETARAFYKELPQLKEFIQSKNRGCETPRGFDVPDVHVNLENMIGDYCKAKQRLNDLVSNLLNDWRAVPVDSINPCDSLATQLRDLNEHLGTAFARRNPFTTTRLPPPKVATSDVATQVVPTIKPKRIGTTCTSLDIPESERIAIVEVKPRADTETQTEPVVIVPPRRESASDDDIPSPPTVEASDGCEMIPSLFCQNLLSNQHMIQNIAETINRQMNGNNDEAFDIVKEVSHKSENEIDNFLQSLLHGEENSQGGVTYTWKDIEDDANIFESEEPNFSNMFKPPSRDSNSLEDGEILETEDGTPMSTPVLLLPTEPVALKQSDPPPFPTQETSSAGTSSQLNPTPVSIHVPPPAHLVSVHTPSTPWQLLGRRSIAPKIPSPPRPKIIPPPVQIQTQSIPSQPCGSSVVRTIASNDIPTPVTPGGIRPSISVPNEQGVPESKGCYEMVSPLLQRLVLSAKRQLGSSSLDREKKSYSTPRKRKHVRSLVFTTPPNLAGVRAATAVTTNHVPENRGITQGQVHSAPQPRKRKAPQPMNTNPSAPESKSRKRLDYEDDKGNKNNTHPHQNNPHRNKQVEKNTREHKSSREREQRRHDEPKQKSHERSRSPGQKKSRERSPVPHRSYDRGQPHHKSRERSPAQRKTRDQSPNRKRSRKQEQPQQSRSRSNANPQPSTSRSPEVKSRNRESTIHQEKSRTNDQNVILPAGGSGSIGVEPCSKSLGRKQDDLPLIRSNPKGLHYTSCIESVVQNNLSSIATKIVTSKNKYREPGNSNNVNTSTSHTQKPSPPEGKAGKKIASKSKPEKTVSPTTAAATTTNVKPPRTSNTPPLSLPPKSNANNSKRKSRQSEEDSANQALADRAIPLGRASPVRNRGGFNNTSNNKNNNRGRDDLLKPNGNPKICSQPLPAGNSKSTNPPVRSKGAMKEVENVENSNSLPPILSPLKNTPIHRSQEGQTSLPPGPRRISNESLQMRQKSGRVSRPLVAPPPVPSPIDNAMSGFASTKPQPAPNFLKVPESLAVPTFRRNNSNSNSLEYNRLFVRTPVKFSGESGGSGENANSLHAPPTPRIVNFSSDSWESNDAHITLNYENSGVYPSNLFPSPIRLGIPRTPGRSPPDQEDNSQSSSSIFDTPDMGQYKDPSLRLHPVLGDLNTPVPQMQGAAGTTPVIVSSTQPENCDVSSTSQELSRANSSQQMNPGYSAGSLVQLEVSGRAKQLTMSEQQTLYSLLRMREGIGSPNTKLLTDSLSTNGGNEKDFEKMLKNVNMQDFLSEVHGDDRIKKPHTK